MVPLPPLLLPHPGNLPGPVPAFPHGLATGCRSKPPFRRGSDMRLVGVANYTPGSGLPLNWFDGDQQRHKSAYRMDNIPTVIGAPVVSP